MRHGNYTQERLASMITDETLYTVSKLLRRVFVGKMEEQELHDAVLNIDKEIIRRRLERAHETRKH
jgi:hypothetical protein